MKNIIAIVFLLLLYTPQKLRAQTRPMQFETGTWSEIKQKATKENKMIFVDAFTTWCGPCKWMAKTVFTNDTVANYYNTNFINAQIDMEKGEGKDLLKEWSVNAFPSLLYFSPQGELLHRSCGAYPAADFIKEGTNALNPETQFATTQKKYNTGTADADFVAAYIKTLNKKCLPFAKESIKYFATQSNDDLLLPRNWELMKVAVNDMTSGVFVYLEHNTAAFARAFGSEEVKRKIEDVYKSTLMNALYNDKGAHYQEVKQKVLAKAYLNHLPKKAVSFADMNYYQQQKDWKNYAIAAIHYTDTYDSANYNHLNIVAYTFYENVKDKAHLQKALQWAKKSVEISEDGANLDTYACLLYATGNKQAAIDNQKRAVALAKTSGDETMVQELEKHLKKFESQ